MKKTLFKSGHFPNRALAISLVLFVWCVTAFQFVNQYVFTPMPGADHIIDSHLQECYTCFFDKDYVMLAAGQYDPSKYTSYYILDLIFLFVYSITFLLLASAWNKKPLFRVYFVSIIAGAAFDFLENTGFALYLHNKMPGYATWVSVFTTCKSVLFLLNMLAAAGLFLFPPRKAAI